MRDAALHSNAVTFRAVAQLGRAPASGAGGRGFESRQPDNIQLDLDRDQSLRQILSDGSTIKNW